MFIYSELNVNQVIIIYIELIWKCESIYTFSLLSLSLSLSLSQKKTTNSKF